ncbi:MAG TPA: ABC transporter permease [Anaerolineaceae bacterium]|jgi:oligopeptide transport system permease protein|nr:ABC transporter permease [Longilinea sp.]HNR46633.1 ABC transporter permease [Anaerolineaceae bacterium]HNS36529.1 ABC transporter permease [Anaerolineaceae bacterium]HNZ12744.1 ABC transporter permease [Anaerolineaceae bacterium]HOD03880.1 ABC transporter permease [Anaerolineaceae bacterium]
MAETPSKIVTFELPEKRRSLWGDAWYRLVRNKASVAGMIIILAFFLIAIFAGAISKQNPLEVHSGTDYLPPVWVEKGINGKPSSPDYLLGTDTLGRDVLARVLYGARVSMVVGIVPTLIVLIVGTIVGLIAGFFGGIWDNLLMRFTDIVWSFPDLLFFIIIMIALRDTFIGNLLNGLFLLFAALAMVGWVGEARVVRGQVLSLKEKEFVEAARCIGAKNGRIMFKHIMPNALGPIIIMGAMTVPGMIITEATLGFLGLGMRPASDPNNLPFFVTSWGVLMNEGNAAIHAQPWLLLMPAICVSLVVLAFTFLGDGLRDALDPRMQGTS